MALLFQIGVQALDGDNRTFVELCHGALGDIVHGRKQSQCQTMPGMRAFRTDVITSSTVNQLYRTCD